MKTAGMLGRMQRNRWGLAGALVIAVIVATMISLSGCGDDDCDLVIETDLLPAGVVGQFYEFEMDSDCGGYWYLKEGNLPPGIAFEIDGDLVGTPTVPGHYFFTVGLEGYFSGATVFKGFSLSVE